MSRCSTINYIHRFKGLPDQGGYIFVLENAGQSGPGIALNLFEQQTFSPENGLEIQGNSSVSEVYFCNCLCLKKEFYLWSTVSFTYKFDTKKMADKMGTYVALYTANTKAPRHKE